MDDLIELRELYGKAKKYIEEEWKKDPETEPYKSKYKAAEFLKIIEGKLNELVDKDYGNVEKCKGMLAVVLLQLGIIAIDTEEMSSGEKYLNESLSCLSDELTFKNVLISLMVYNQLGILWCQRSENEKAQKYLEDCEEMYHKYLSVKRNELPWSLHDHFEKDGEGDEAKGREDIGKVHTLTKFYLAQIYGKLGDSIKSSIYCHETLRRQLEYKEYDPIDWALNAATLSQFFMEQKLFSQARHHLAAASFILDRYEETLKSLEASEEEMEAKKEEFRHRSADVARCWIKYCIFILEHSRDIEAELSKNPQELFDNCWFSSMELGEYENQIPDALVTDYVSAKDIVILTQKFFATAKEYYSLENHASDYVQIIQDHSTLIRHLTWFQKDEGILCKMIKRRINMLEDVVKELNPQYYLNVCRALWFELGECYHDLMHNKESAIRQSGNSPNPAMLKKANHLAEQSIQNFKLFVDSTKDKQNQKLPDPLPEDLLRPTLVAHFFLGRLNYKLVSPDKRQIMKNTYEALCCFKYVVEYCNEHPKGLSAATEEYQLSEEMMRLLELRLKQNINLIS